MATSASRSDAGSGRMEEEGGIVSKMYKYGGAFSLIGLTFFYQKREGKRPILIRLTGLQKDGESYRAKNVRTEKNLADSVTPSELTIGASSRGPRDAVIVLLKNLRMPFRQYLDPLAKRPESRVGNFWTPESELNLTGDRRGPPASSAASVGTGRENRGGLSAGAVDGERLGTPQQGAQWSPFCQPSAPLFVHAVPSGFQQAAIAPEIPPAAGRGFQPVAGMDYQQASRPIRRAPAVPPMQQMAGGFAGSPQGQEGQDESVHYEGDGYGEGRMSGLGRAGNQNPVNLQQQDGNGVEPLKARIAALESKHQMERLRGAMSSELRRMQSGVSPFEHPGVYLHVDQMVTIHELPRTWTGPHGIGNLRELLDCRPRKAGVPRRGHLGVHHEKVR
jgi:hypothetical protein